MRQENVYWAAEDIPSNKLESMGVRNLTDVELVSIVIGNGDAEASLEKAREFLSKFGYRLDSISMRTPSQMWRDQGIEEKDSLRMLASLELGRRMIMDAEKVEKIDCSVKAYMYSRKYLSGLDHEEFWLFSLKANKDIISFKQISKGGIDATLVDLRVLFKEAIVNSASIIVAVHNHPSGSVRPSRDDDMLTDRIQRAAKMLDFKFLDHIIVADGQYYSYKEEGKL